MTAIRRWLAHRADRRDLQTTWIRLRLEILQREDAPGAADALADFERTHPRRAGAS